MMPENISSFGGDIDSLTWLITVITMVCLIIAEAFLFIAVIRFHRSTTPTASYITGVGWKQLRYVVIPVILVVFLDFYIDVKNARAWTEIKQTLPADGIHVGVTAEQFLWTFTYPGKDGVLLTADDVGSDEMHVPLGVNVTFHLQAKDVLHSFWVPVLRLKMDALPGRIERGWFKATKLGTYDIACAEICGEGHSKMAARLVVDEPSDYERWLKEATENPQPKTAQDLLKVKGCLGCHSTDGSTLVGPSYKGLFGKTETVVTDGVERQVTVDEEYLRQSILKPKADVVKGFAPVMPDLSSKLSKEEVTRIVEFLKTVK